MLNVKTPELCGGEEKLVLSGESRRLGSEDQNKAKIDGPDGTLLCSLLEWPFQTGSAAPYAELVCIVSSSFRGSETCKAPQ